MKTIIFVILGVLIVMLGFQFAQRRQKEFKEESQICEQECKAQGYAGWEYKAGSFAKGQCQCLDG